ncbi:hypothetical protein PhCBS80983_g00654 [Powellomyces hirtus]|uniref:NudC domain-containing protein 1 n=1 Tax=Powellomyces hirtus TaxID=109895 RepID=A0A507EEC8_9FUNG|nr:hypothetical protein PhCBS80983_g00654 [Powellomyces hirtus]
MPSPDPTQQVELPIDRSLLNPKFEGYKLKLEGPFREPGYHPLPTPIAIANVPSSSHDPFRKLQARSSFNHLFAFAGYNGALYVDGHYNVVNVAMDEATYGLSFQTVCQLPAPSLPATAREYPSVQRAGSHIVASSGAGSVVVMETVQSFGTGTPANDTLITGIGDYAYILLDAKITDSGKLLYLAYRMEEREVDVPKAHTTTAFADKTTLEKKPRLSFILGLFSVDVIAIGGSPDVPATTLSTVEGFSVPYFATIEPDGKGFTVCASTLFGVQNGTTDETVPAPPTPLGLASAKPKPANYQWYQTGQDITVSIRLPAQVTKKDIYCVFTPTSLKCRTLRPSEHTLLESKLFDTIVPSECIWTLEDEDQTMLTLYLQKTHEGTRWSHLWDHEDDDGVEETLDPAELAAFAQALDKYTADDAPPETPALAMDTASRPMQNAMTEPSEDVDFEGDAAIFARFATSASNREPTHVCRLGAQEWLCSAFPWRPPSTALQRQPHPFHHHHHSHGVALRSDIDALTYTLLPPLTLQPAGAFNALGFVQASKRDKRFMAFTYDSRYAFIAETRRLVYIYARTEPGQIHADQYLIDLGVADNGTAGDVVGLQQVDAEVLLVLREGGISVIDWRQPA